MKIMANTKSVSDSMKASERISADWTLPASSGWRATASKAALAVRPCAVAPPMAVSARLRMPMAANKPIDVIATTIPSLPACPRARAAADKPAPAGKSMVVLAGRPDVDRGERGENEGLYEAGHQLKGGHEDGQRQQKRDRGNDADHHRQGGFPGEDVGKQTE